MHPRSPVLMDTNGDTKSSLSPSSGMLHTFTVPSPPPVARLLGQNGSNSSPRTCRWGRTEATMGLIFETQMRWSLFESNGRVDS